MDRDPAELSPAERYALLTGAIVPRPIAVVATISPDGLPNLAPFSFFAPVGVDPMMLLFCPGNAPDGTPKDSLRNAAPEAEGGTGCFVVSVATEANLDRVVVAAEPLPHGESEFELAGLTTAPARSVPAPRLAESPVAFECRTEQVIRTAPGAPGAGNVVVGRVTWVHVDDALLDERLRVDADGLRAVGRMGGRAYATTRDRLERNRGRAARPGA